MAARASYCRSSGSVRATLDANEGEWTHVGDERHGALLDQVEEGADVTNLGEWAAHIFRHETELRRATSCQSMSFAKSDPSQALAPSELDSHDATTRLTLRLRTNSVRHGLSRLTRWRMTSDSSRSPGSPRRRKGSVRMRVKRGERARVSPPFAKLHNPAACCPCAARQAARGARQT